MKTPKKKTSIRFSTDAEKMVKELTVLLGGTQSQIIELAIRELAIKHNILKTPRHIYQRGDVVVLKREMAGYPGGHIVTLVEVDRQYNDVYFMSAKSEIYSTNEHAVHFLRHGEDEETKPEKVRAQVAKEGEE